MEIGRYFIVLVAVLVFYSSVHTTAQGAENAQAMACIQKLMPCQPYLHKLNPPPPPSCCGPMKEMVEKDARCLCAVFNNPEMLKPLNLTKENALDLPKACGANPNVSLCTKTASSPPTASPGSATKGSSSPPAVSFTGFSFVSAFVAIIIIFF